MFLFIAKQKGGVKMLDERYQNVAEMIDDIEAFMQNPEISFGYYEENADGDLVDCEKNAAGESRIATAVHSRTRQRTMTKS